MELFKADLDGYELRILDITDTVSTAIVKHEFVNTDGALLENMGNRPRVIKFKVFFYGSTPDVSEQVAATYLNHYDFVKEMSDSMSLHTLTHPKYGIVKGMIETMNIIHDDTQEYVAIEVTFVEQGIYKKIVSDVAAVDKIMQMQQVALLNAEIAKVEEEIAAKGHSTLLGKVVDGTKSLLSQFSNISNKTREFVKGCDSFVNNIDSFLSDVEAPVNSINSAVNYVGDLPSLLCSKVQDCTDRVMNAASNLSNLPVQLINNSIMSVRNLSDSITGKDAEFFQKHIISIGAGTISAKSGLILQDDENNRAQAANKEKSVAFDINGRRVDYTPMVVILSSTEIDEITYNARAIIQEAIDLDRNNQELKAMANIMILFVDDIKLKRRAIVNMTVNSIPIHMLCMQLGLPYGAADRLLQLNPHIKNPTFTEGTVKVYVS
jgi:prophage DNA circulation protein